MRLGGPVKIYAQMYLQAPADLKSAGNGSSSKATFKCFMFMYFLQPHWVPAAWRSRAQTSIRAEFPSGNVPTTRVGGSHGSAARSRCWYGCASNARLGSRSRSAFPLYNFLGHSLLSPFRMVCGNFILPEPACYVFFYAIFNLRNLLYIIFVCAPCPCFRRCYDYSPLPAKHVYFWANTSLRRSHRRQMVVI